MSLSLLSLVAATAMGTSPSSKFANSLWSHTKAQPGENMVLSPLSAQLALALLANAAGGNTQKAIFNTMQEPSADLGTFNQHWSQLAHNLQSGGLLNIANSTFTAKGLGVSRQYKARVTQSLHASHLELKGSGTIGANQINAWVKKNTKNRIEKLFDSLSPNEKSILVNCITFDGKWDTPFDKALTTPKGFASSHGKQQVPMMKRSGPIIYGETSGSTYVRLDYKGGPFSMVLMLPKAGSNPETTLKRFDEAALTNALNTQAVQLDLELPRFEIKSEPPIEQALKDMGLASLFTHADFRPMVPSGEMNALGRIVQKTYIKVDEAGTKAAAATGIAMTRAMMPAQKKIEFHVNRPFAFVIVDRTSNSIAFMGTIHKI